MIMPTWVEGCQNFDFSMQKSWFLCDTNSNYFHHKNATSFLFRKYFRGCFWKLLSHLNWPSIFVFYIQINLEFKLLTLKAPISQNGQTHSNCRQIVWVCLTIMWDWRLKGNLQIAVDSLWQLETKNLKNCMKHYHTPMQIF